MATITSDGVAGIKTLSLDTPATAQALAATGSTIQTAGLSGIRVSAAAPVTASTLAAGTPGQEINIFNESANSVAITIGVAITVTITTLTGQRFVYNDKAAAPAWYIV